MSRGVATILKILIIAEALLLLLPTSIICSVGLFFAAAFIVRSPANFAIWMLAGCVLLMAYSLFTLWWLTFKYRSVQLSTIPRFIWYGLGLGVVAASALSFPHLFSVATGKISLEHNVKYILGFGIGPVIVLVTLLTTIWARAESAP